MREFLVRAIGSKCSLSFICGGKQIKGLNEKIKRNKGSQKHPPLSAARRHRSPEAVSSLDTLNSLPKQHENEYNLWVAQTHVTNAVWTILGLNLSRPGNLDFGIHEIKFLSMSRLFSALNVPELLLVSRKNFQVSRSSEKFPNSRNNFGFVPKQRLLELSTPSLTRK